MPPDAGAEVGGDPLGGGGGELPVGDREGAAGGVAADRGEGAADEIQSSAGGSQPAVSACVTTVQAPSSSPVGRREGGQQPVFGTGTDSTDTLAPAVANLAGP